MVGFHDVSQKPTPSPSHTHAFSHTIIQSIPSAKSYTYTLNKLRHISYLIKKMIFLAFPLMILSLSTFVVCWKPWRVSERELWGTEQFEDLFSLIFLDFPRASKTVKSFKGLTENAVSQKTPAVL